MVQSGQFFCGPLALSLNAPRDALLDKFVATRGLYDVVWEPPHLAVKIDVVRAGVPAPMAVERKVVGGLPPGIETRALEIYSFPPAGGESGGEPKRTTPAYLS